MTALVLCFDSFLTVKVSSFYKKPAKSLLYCLTSIQMLDNELPEK